MFLEKKTANGIKMVRFTRNDSCFLRLGDLCEFQEIKTAAAPKQEETLQASRIHSSESCIRKSFVNPIKLEKSPNLPQHLQPYREYQKVNIYLDFPGSAVVENLPANARDTGSIPELGRSLEKEMTTHTSILT